MADVAFVGGRLNALISGAGCSHGLAGTVNSILRIEHDGSATQVADLSQFLMTHPVAHPNPGDFEPDGTWFSMVEASGALFAVEPNHGEVDVVSRDGAIRRLLDVSATQGHVVPTSIAVHGNTFFLGNLGQFAPGSEGKAVRVSSRPTRSWCGTSPRRSASWCPSRLLEAAQARGPRPGGGRGWWRRRGPSGRHGPMTTRRSGPGDPGAD